MLECCTMKITFLGTGADDWDWRNPAPGTRKSTCTLVGATVLVDAGPCVLAGLADAGARPARVADLLVTHTHGDHFNPDAVMAIAGAGRRKLRVWGPPTVADMLPGGLARVDFHPLLPGDGFRVAGMRAVALPANHAVAPRSAEQPLHYAISGRGANLLYALDGGWLCAKARLWLGEFLRGKPLDAIVWDATCGNTFRDWRFAEHNDLRMIDAMREGLVKLGIASAETLHVFDHVARTLWPADAAEHRRLAECFGGMVAEDGLELDVNEPAR